MLACLLGIIILPASGAIANTQISILEYEGKAPLIFETQGLPRAKGMKAMNRYRQNQGIGNVIECEGGYLSISSGGGGSAFDWNDKKIKQFKGGGSGEHQNNFIDAIRSRKPSDLNADIEGGHYSSALCHLGQISHALGTKSSSDEIAEAFEGNTLAEEVLTRYSDHMEKNEVDLELTPATLGPLLTFDPARERFAGNANKNLELVANGMLRRNYREPFVVPEKV